VLFLGKSDQGAVTPLMSLADVLSWYQEWGYWVWLAVMLAGQALLLLVPLASPNASAGAARPCGRQFSRPLSCWPTFFSGR